MVFAAWDNYTEERINKVFARNNAERNLPDSATDGYRNMLLNAYLPKSAEENFNHTAKQSYIAFTTAMLAAAEQKVDSTPMEGFDCNALDILLNLKEIGLSSVTLLPLGYRDEQNDWLVNMKKVRLPLEEFVIELN